MSLLRARCPDCRTLTAVAVDDRYATWDAWANQYWPADYLIDRSGDVRDAHFGVTNSPFASSGVPANALRRGGRRYRSQSPSVMLD